MAGFPDVVVLLPGITGSVLARKDGKEVWSPSAGAIWRAVTSLGGSIKDLELDENAGDDGVTAPRLIPDVTIVPGLIKIDGYSRIERYLIEQLELTPGRNYFSFPYDWRRDNRQNAQRLQRQAHSWLNAWRASSGAADARLVLIGHSMGGLISRYFLECLEGWKSTRALITLGTPHRGSVNAIDFLVHGMKKGVGPLGLDLTPLLRSLPSVYQLLPIYPCVDVGAAELARVAAAAQAASLPNVDARRAADARAFHAEIEQAQSANVASAAYADGGYTLIPVVGIEQPTFQSVLAKGGGVEMLRSYAGEDMGGDGTVPRVSATPIEMSETRREIYAAEMHGSLQNADGPLANVKGALTRSRIDLGRFRAPARPAATLTLEMDDVVLPGEPLIVRARASSGEPQISVQLTHVADGKVLDGQLKAAAGAPWQQASFERLAPGAWRVRIASAGASPVTDLAVVAQAA
jgi:pimeloyl-ACP methyl ester carboxylesterase